MIVVSKQSTKSNHISQDVADLEIIEKYNEIYILLYTQQKEWTEQKEEEENDENEEKISDQFKSIHRFRHWLGFRIVMMVTVY